MKPQIIKSLKPLEKTLFFLAVLFLPTQLGKHFWPDFSFVYSLQLLCNFENLFGSCPPEYVFCHHSPANCAGRIDKKLCRTRNVCAVFSLARMDQIIAPNCFDLWIGEKSKSVSGRLQHVLAIDLRTINTDGNGADSRLRKRLQIVLDAPQLGVT